MNKRLYKLMNWPVIEEIIYSESDNPHAILGPHVAGTQTLVQAYFPEAVKVKLIIKATSKEYLMEMADDDGFFVSLIPGKNIGRYYYEVMYDDNTSRTVEDAYAFEPVISDKDIEHFESGIHYTIYDKLGAHLNTIAGVSGVSFAVWAPNAVRVSVVGDFNNWDGRIHQMRRLGDSGIFEIFVPGAKENDNYKFELKVKGGLTYLKADPYANASQLRPETASVVTDISGFAWEDEKWINGRADRQKKNAPMSIYELYLGSFDRSAEGNADDGSVYLNYRTLAPKVIAYVKGMGYTHVELMPVMEHPFDASWGYQTIGYYAPTSRYGSPKDFMYFVNELHKAGIGVILDWVPAHFPRDVHGLSAFDGTCLYEHADPRQGSHPHWGTLIYNYGRPQVSNYLIANALFWVEKYHADGIRMDAVASMLYLDYGKQDGEWVANIYGGNENLEAVEFIKHLNSIIHKRNPGVLTIAEESTAWPKVTGDLNDGGLGFDIKWNMGWMNDFLGYMQNDPYFRGQHQNELTFSMIYAYSENFMLVFSHDEVVHGKGAMVGKMPGGRDEKFANLRLAYAYMMTHPGKKLLFMGQDIAEFDEWNERRSVEWELAQYDEHKGIQTLVKELNSLYVSTPAFYIKDNVPDGFEWINCIDAQRSYVSFLRKGDNGQDTHLVIANFAGIPQDLHLGVPLYGKFTEILNTDDKKFGGNQTIKNRRVIKSSDDNCDERPYSVNVSVPALSVCVYSFESYTEDELEEIAKKKQEEMAERIAKEREAEAKAAIELAKAEAKAAKDAQLKAEAAAKEAAEKKALARKASRELKAAREAANASKL